MQGSHVSPNLLVVDGIGVTMINPRDWNRRRWMSLFQKGVPRIGGWLEERLFALWQSVEQEELAGHYRKAVHEPLGEQK